MYVVLHLLTLSVMSPVLSVISIIIISKVVKSNVIISIVLVSSQIIELGRKSWQVTNQKLWLILLQSQYQRKILL